ncbi:uncharacterized protein LOC141641622 [Silene latifolia]|uniref:uncharacterized protein LOC141641622 n=1 Tax=Silene latifolia TaxID=37657 RepID=UPI003D7724EE
MVSPRCLFKLDLQKAYDSIEWQFVEQMLDALNFPSKFKKWVMCCISSPTYSLSLNGAQFGYFKERRGLRQGDPISPLLFCICMEYLSRILDYATSRWFFRYHPLCKSLKLTHLLFADDLLMFCKGDVKSIMLLLRALSTFSASSGLRVNASKSEVVFNGVAVNLKLDIIQVSGFQEGSLPFKYLGIPVQAVRLKRSDCKVLIDKIVYRIRGIGARKLSYARADHGPGRAGNFLWTGDAEYHRVPLVAWQKVCCSKKEGGLGVKDARVWNIATVGKLVNWIYTKAYRLWVLWIDHVYMKGADWNSYQPPPDSNWNWRNICKVRTMLAAGFQGTQWLASPTGYTVASGYQWMQGAHPPVPWFKDVWDGWAIPKHSLIGWLIKHEALNTRAKLFSLGLCSTNRCVLCEKEEEGHGHLFGSFWMERNKCRIEFKLRRPGIVADEIKTTVKSRLLQIVPRPVLVGDSDWLVSLGLNI